MGELDVLPGHVDHPLWTRFLRWSTIRPKSHEKPRSNNLVVTPHEIGMELEALDDYEYVPLPDALSFIRLAVLQPGMFRDEIAIRLEQHVLRPPSKQRPSRLTLVDIRRDLPIGWEAYQTIIENEYFFRNTETGTIQWEHPDPGFHIENYQLPPRNDGVVPRYETVSYVWGDPVKSSRIRVDDANGSYKLAVTQSLSTVLRYLRYSDHTRTLWIDAICLNQHDYDELSRQVPRMRDIYSLAYRSTLWLGKEDVESTDALNSLRYIGDQVVAEADTGLLFCAPGAEQNNWFDPDVTLPLSNEKWDGIRALLHRPWFHRLWVVQEIQPGALVQCGQNQVSVGAITEAIYCLYSKTHLPHGLRPHLEQAVGTLARLPALCFTRLLYRASTFKDCSDPRDKIYGLLGLAPPKFVASVKVNYEEANTATDVYAMTVINHAEICQRLEHFHNCFTNRSIIPDAPTWVPDWYSDVPGNTYIPALFATSTSRAHYTCSYASKGGGGQTGNPDILRVHGVFCGEVNSTTAPLQSDIGGWEALTEVRKWQPDDLDTSIYKPTGESTRKAYAITLICNILKEREPDWILTPTDEWVKQDWDQALFGSPADSHSSTIYPANMRSDVSDALQCCSSRLFFRTHEGYMGLGPGNTEVGDIIAIFLGCSTPLVLRPNVRGPKHFTVVGECFVYGLHDAIALLGPLPHPWRGIAAWVDGDRRCLRFLNPDTREVTKEDPRLGPLYDWERTDKLVDGDDPTMYDFFRHKKTGELINYDPRLEPEFLEAKGVSLDWFSLV